MNIVLASDSYFPVISGVTTVVYKTALELTKRKHQVSIICMGTKTRFSSSKERGLSVFRFPSILNPVRTDHYFPIPLSLKMQRKMDQLRPDVIHIHTPGTIGLWALIFAQKHKIPLVVTCHGVPSFVTSYFDFLPEEFSKSVEKALWRCYSWFFNQVDLVLAPSKYIKNQLKKNGVERKIAILPMWIDSSQKIKLSKKQLRKKWKIPEDKVVFLYFGRLDKDKNLKFLIRAMQILNNGLKTRAFLLMAGKGCQQEKLEEVVAQKKLANFIKFTGVIKGERIGEIYEASDVFVMPALFEAQNITGLKAISYGLPVIVAKSGALTEIAKKFPKYCTTFDPQNIKSLVGKMEKFIINPPVKKHKPTQKFRLAYNKNIILNRLESIYFKVKRHKICISCL